MDRILREFVVIRAIRLFGTAGHSTSCSTRLGGHGRLLRTIRKRYLSPRPRSSFFRHGGRIPVGNMLSKRRTIVVRNHGRCWFTVLAIVAFLAAVAVRVNELLSVCAFIVTIFILTWTRPRRWLNHRGCSRCNLSGHQAISSVDGKLGSRPCLPSLVRRSS